MMGRAAMFGIAITAAVFLLAQIDVRGAVLSPKGKEQAPTLTSVLRSEAASMPVPQAAIVPPKTNTYYFAATALAGTLESDFSNEATLGVTNSPRGYKVRLGWDMPPSNVVVTSYSAYYGSASRSYTNSVTGILSNGVTFYLAPPMPTNVVISVTSVKATNLQWALKPTGPWTLYGATNFIGTNPPSRFWRGVYKSKANAGKLGYSVRMQ